jgi:hypothetical protein
MRSARDLGDPRDASECGRAVDRSAVGLVAARHSDRDARGCGQFSIGPAAGPATELVRNAAPLCLTLDPERELLLTATGTTAARFLPRAAHLFDLPLLVLEPSGTRETLDSWFMRRLAMEEVAGSGMNVAWSAWVSPCLGEDPGGAAPLGDRLVLATSARVLVSHVRPGGQIGQLVQQRLLARREGAAVAVILAVGEGLVPEPVARAWIPWGAAVVRVDAPDPQPQAAIVPVTDAADQATHAPIWSLSELADRVAGDEYLTHCTRAARGPWPDESLDDYLDQLILGGRESDRSALATLSRIARRQRILASAESIRGTRPVVCFTAVPLAELPRLRTFRPHRGRWDFEPYGISLRRQWLQQHGARPVRYGDASLWERLPNAERPFFQCRYAGKDRTIDWSIEREWRHVGDLDLSRLPDDAAWLVVPTREEARLLSPWSRWPIVVMDAELGTGDR